MNRKELSDYVSGKMNITKTDAKLAVEAVVAGLIEGISKEGKVTVIGLGSFYTLKRTARVIKNPKTGEVVNVPERTVVKFKGSKILKDFLKKI